jgi:alpha-beta hydrolase superfamily lysophospholipase
LTLHGKRFDVLGKAFAIEGFYTCAPDMRGFGRCYSDKDGVFCGDGQNRRKIDMEKSYEEIVALATKLKQKYPEMPLFAMGESLGTSFCIRLSAEHHDLVDGLILSGPTVQVHPLMFLHPSNMAAAAWALFVHPKFKMNTSGFVKNLVSNDPNIINEMLNDPLCRKSLTIADLLNTQAFVKKTLPFASKIKPDQPILVLQGSEDRCMVPEAVTRLSKQIHSADQTVRWLHAHGHLLLETAFLRPATVDALGLWVREHEPAHEQEERELSDEMEKIGARVEPDQLEQTAHSHQTETQEPQPAQ